MRNSRLSPERLKTFGLRLALLVSSCAAAALCAELVVRSVCFSAEQREHGVSALYRGERSAIMDPFDPESPRDCEWFDSVIGHPFLNFVHHSLPPCGQTDIDLQGFTGRRDIPLVRDPRYFTILVVGASVAEQMATFVRSPDHILLEEVLNARLEAPGKRPIRVLNAAMGATAIPTENVANLLYSNAADGVIAIDGFNEAVYSQYLFLGTPGVQSRALIVSPETRRLSLRIALCHAVRNFFVRSVLTKNSFAGFLLQRKIVACLLAGQAADATEPEELRTYMSQYVPPAGWTSRQLDDWNKERYKTFIQENYAVASAVGARYAHFLQPIPAFKAVLTPDEKSHPLLVSKERYAKFMKAVDELRDRRRSRAGVGPQEEASRRLMPNAGPRRGRASSDPRPGRSRAGPLGMEDVGGFFGALAALLAAGELKHVVELIQEFPQPPQAVPADVVGARAVGRNPVSALVPVDAAVRLGADPESLGIHAQRRVHPDPQRLSGVHDGDAGDVLA
jgi:hypothetical protein